MATQPTVYVNGIAVSGGGVGVPQQAHMGSMPTFANTMDVFVKSRGMFIAEDVNVTEVVTGCTMEKSFNVSLWDPSLGVDQPKKGKGPDVFRMKETSDCCQRVWCGSNRAFSVALAPSQPLVSTYNPSMLSRETIFNHPDAMIMERPFTCTCCCINRPKMYMRHQSAGRFATIVNPCTLCNYQFNIYAASPSDGGLTPVNPSLEKLHGYHWYTVSGSCWQPGAWCFCPCGECSKVRFQIYEGADTMSPKGEIQRVFPGCCKAGATVADDFTISFPQETDPLKRSSLMAAVILANYLFYDQKDGDNSDSGASSASS